jgi:hypothetical protein
LSCLLPFASASAPACQALGAQLHTPHLNTLLAELTRVHTDTGTDHDFSLPHERALARQVCLLAADGQPLGDGLLPWAAWASAQQQTISHTAADLPQAWFTPCHFQVGMEQVTLLSADQLVLSEAESRALFDALAPFCAEDGIQLRFDHATRWHASGPPLRGLVCASLDRVTGRPVDAWLTHSTHQGHAQLIKRLQSEAQMLFYTHPVNDAREAARQPTLNGLWIHGAGALPGPLPAVPPPHMPDALRTAALRDDWAAWQAAWAALDAELMAPLLAAARQGEAVSLTLCGERNAQQWVSRPRQGLARLRHWIHTRRSPAPAWNVLQTL